jgi:hypothetical protein
MHRLSTGLEIGNDARMELVCGGASPRQGIRSAWLRKPTRLACIKECLSLQIESCRSFENLDNAVEVSSYRKVRKGKPTLNRGLCGLPGCANLPKFKVAFNAATSGAFTPAAARAFNKFVLNVAAP